MRQPGYLSVGTTEEVGEPVIVLVMRDRAGVEVDRVIYQPLALVELIAELAAVLGRLEGFEARVRVHHDDPPADALGGKLDAGALRSMGGELAALVDEHDADERRRAALRELREQAQ